MIKRYNYYIGIDPGTNTGLALWDGHNKKFMHLQTYKIHNAMKLIESWYDSMESVLVRFEDARLRVWFGTAGREKLQGVGSIKRDCAIWEDFLTDLKIPFEAVKPRAGMTKWSAEYFAKITGWKERTTVHSRDAGALVFGI